MLNSSLLIRTLCHWHLIFLEVLLHIRISYYFIFANQNKIENFFDYEPYAIENFEVTEVSNVVTIKGFTKSGKQIKFTEATNLVSTDDLGTAITFTPTNGALVSSAIGATATLLSVYGIANGFIFNENFPV